MRAERKRTNKVAWSREKVNKCASIIRKHRYLSDALTEISKLLGASVNDNMLRRIFSRYKMVAPSFYLLQEKSKSEELEKLVLALKTTQGSTPISMEALCNKLDMSPKRVQAVLAEAEKAGINVNVMHGAVGMIKANAPTRIQDSYRVAVSPVIGDTVRVAVISDLHYGSKYCLKEYINDFVDYAYAQGVRVILGPGDNVDGCYGFSQFELTHSGLEAQTQEFVDNLPKKPGLSYHFVTGNHDETFWTKTGVNVGQYAEGMARAQGRDDIHYHGDRSAYIYVGDILFHLWHPSGGMSYAKSYRLQKKCESYSSGEKPDVLLVGHWHQYCVVDVRGIHAIACPTFQGPGSRFGNTLTEPPVIGGLLLQYDVTKEGTMRNFSITKRSYFVNEHAHRLGAESKTDFRGGVK